MQLCSVLLASLALAAGVASAQPHWPQFRGPGGSGISSEGALPLHFGPETNVVWKATLPEGHSSPCIWGDRIFVTGYAEGKLQILCVNRADGKELWRRQVEPGKIERGTQLSSPATATPASDGRGVYVYFGSLGLLAYDFEGREIWRRTLPVPVTQHGPGTSPVLAGELLLLNCDQDTGSYLLAVDAETGEKRWQADRSDFRRGFSTPLAWPAEKPELVVVAGTLRLVAYDLKDGAVRWTVNGLPNEMVSSPVSGEGLIFAAGWTHGAGVPRMPKFDALLKQGDKNQDGKLARAEAPTGPARQHFIYIDANKDEVVTRAEYESMAAIFEKAQNACLAVKPGGRGDVTETHVAWKQTRGLPYVPTSLCYKGRLYLIKNGGMASCFDAVTGKPYYLEERLGIMGDNYASPIAAGDRICVISQTGAAGILGTGDTLEVLARNALGEPILATPAVVGRTLYVRGKTTLWAFAEDGMGK